MIFPIAWALVSGIFGMAFLLPIMFDTILERLGINSGCFLLQYSIVAVSLDFVTEARHTPVKRECERASKTILIANLNGKGKENEPFSRTPHLPFPKT
ncbi:MAG: hypothetical protein WBA29_01950 [Xanthobacteraceae bacterium]